jgi:DNA-directed RNA polymerase II subunit RPB1
MNLHVAQDFLSGVEVQELMSLPHHIVTPQNSEPITALKQDSLLGVYLITLPGVTLSRDQFCQLSMAVHYPRRSPSDFLQSGKQRWPGSDIVALCLPPNMRLRHGQMRIERGRLVAGKLLKGGVKAMTHYMWKRGPELACQLLSDLQRVANAYLLLRGVSIGVSDCVVDASTRSALKAMMAKVDSLTSHIDREVARSNFAVKKLEPTVSSLLSSAINYAGQVCQSNLKVDATATHSSNTILAMVESGSKGSMMNIAQMMGVVGQQFVDGRRIKGRLPCFAPGDASPNARGFVRHSYLQGLNPSEFFHHAMGGREGLVDTSVKTATTGYMQRKLIKGMEDCQCAYDGTVRNSRKGVVQYVYGGDNFDGTHLVKHELPLFAMSNDAICDAASSELEASRLLQLRDMIRAERPLSTFRLTWPRDVFVPFQAEWLLDQSMTTACGPGCALTPSMTDAWQTQLQQHLLAGLEAGMPHPTLLRAYAMWHFRHSVLRDKGLSSEGLTLLMQRVLAAIQRATVAPMEMVGALAAESCGEPATQLTLNTFHFSGQVHSVSQGVPRLTELLSMNKSCKTPLMTIPLQAPYCHSEQYASTLAANLAFTELQQLVDSSSVIDTTAMPELDLELETLRARMDCEYAKMRGTNKLTPHALRFVLNMEAMLNRNMTPQIVASRLQDPLEAYMRGSVRTAAGAPDRPLVWLLCSQYSHDTWVLRVRFTLVRREGAVSAKAESPAKGRGPQTAGGQMSMEEHLRRVLTMHVCGMPGVTHAQATKSNREVLDPLSGGVKLEPRWGVMASGCNMVATLLTPTVDAFNVTCNEVMEVWRIFGLEAAAKMLFYEIKRVLSFDSTNLHDRHIMLIVHTMTRLGTIMPMNRYGINKQKTGPLVRSSFEQTVDVLTDAAVFGEYDDMSGVSENIMAGQLAPLGTGGMDIIDPNASVHAMGLAVEDDDVVCSKIDELLPDATLPEPALKLPELDWEGPRVKEARIAPLANRGGYSQFDMGTVVTEASFSTLAVGAYCPASPPREAPQDPGLDAVALALRFCPSSP